MSDKANSFYSSHGIDKIDLSEGVARRQTTQITSGMKYTRKSSSLKSRNNLGLRQDRIVIPFAVPWMNRSSNSS